MLRKLETSNFRMLRANQVSLSPFQVLVGQNATGKSTFLQALQFLADLLRHDAPEAVRRQTGGRHANLSELCFDRERPIALAVEVAVPNGQEDARFRYEVELRNGSAAGVHVSRENLLLLPTEDDAFQGSLFGESYGGPTVHEHVPKGWRKVVSKTREGKDYFRDERTDWNTQFRFGPERAALGAIPEDPDRFPLSIAVRDLLRTGVRTVELDAGKLRGASPPGSPKKLALDGSNLPHAVERLVARDLVLFRQWVDHVRTGVQGLDDIAVIEREEDKHLVLRARFAGREEWTPSWLLSDGTLRMMALTLLSYAATDDVTDVYLIEEPENGLHPLAMQTVFQALSDTPSNVQVLTATHSPIFLSQVELAQTLVFRRAADGSAIVRRGTEVPELGSCRRGAELASAIALGIVG